jgi:hypothetical protein
MAECQPWSSAAVPTRPISTSVLISGPGTVADNSTITVTKLKFDLNTSRTRRAGCPFLDTRWLGHLEWIEVAISMRWRT